MNDFQEQFSLVYDEYIEKIYRFVYLKVNSQEIAEDITSKVFLSGWEAYQKGPERIQNVKAFLYQIARNMVIDHYRGKSRINTVSTELTKEVVDHRTNLHERAVINSDMEAVKLAIHGLKKDYQDVLILHYLEDMGVEDISSILSKPAGTVRVMIHRGLNSLRDKLVDQA